MENLGKNIQNSFSPPVMEARRWLDNISFPDDRPLLNLSQAAPVEPPPLALREAMAGHVFEDDSHLYGPVLGRPDLRQEIAAQWSDIYRGDIHLDDVAITSGCNQAFCAAIMAVASAGDAVILPTPWYFNHKMWLDMAGVEARLLPCGPNMLPVVDQAAALIDDKVKAIILVTPNNPTGAEYPAGLLHEFAQLARRNKLALIIDETYRDFHSLPGPPHSLFNDPHWRDTLIHLYSFSKAYHLTGHRIGALIAAPTILAQVEKFLDTVAICPNPLGQKAALYGLYNLADFVALERQKILQRRQIVEQGFAALDGWHLLGSGAYFAYVEHPFDMASDILAQRLVAEQSLLVLPGTMFGPTQGNGGDGGAEKQLRIAFANADSSGLATLFARLAAFQP